VKIVTGFLLQVAGLCEHTSVPRFETVARFENLVLYNYEERRPNLQVIITVS
jgi:hypothetical protein